MMKRYVFFDRRPERRITSADIRVPLKFGVPHPGLRQLRLTAGRQSEKNRTTHTDRKSLHHFASRTKQMIPKHYDPATASSQSAEPPDKNAIRQTSAA